jgi:hypothetical protein
MLFLRMSFLHLLPACAGTGFAGVNLSPRRHVKGSNPLRHSPVFTGAGSAEAGIQRYLNVISYVSIYTGFLLPAYAGTSLDSRFRGNDKKECG